MKKSNMLKNTGIILFMSVIAKVCSYGWEALLAAKLGVSDVSDSFYMMVGVFGIINPCIDQGVWKVFLPMYKKRMSLSTTEDADRVANVAATLFMLLSLVFIVFLMVFAEPLFMLIANGYTPEKRAMTVQFFRITAPTYLVFSSASIIGAMLQCHDKFVGSQIREAATHVAKIVTFIIVYRFLGIYAAVAAFIMGSLARLLCQLPFVNWGWKFRPSFDFSDPDIKTMLKGLPAVMVTAGIVQINSLIDKTVASNLGNGAVTSLNYGHRLVNVFSGLFTNAIGTAIYPSIAQYVAEKRDQDIANVLSQALRASAFLVLPISVFCALFPTDLVRLAFERGAFDAAATAMTSPIFLCYSVGMIFVGCSTIITNVLYAYGDVKTTMHISILEILLNIVFDLTFTYFAGVAGLALATSVSAMICFVVRFKALSRYVTVELGGLLLEIGKTLTLTVVSGLVPMALLHFVPVPGALLRLIISAAIFGVLYVVGAFALKLTAVDYVTKMLKKKLKLKKN